MTEESENIGEICVLAMCKCKRAPQRKGQRNCHFCNREANKKYKAQMKRDAAKFRQLAQIVRGS